MVDPDLSAEAKIRIKEEMFRFAEILRNMSINIAKSRRHNQVQTVDVEHALISLEEQVAKNRKRDAALIFGPLIISIVIPTFLDALPRTVNGTLVYDTNSIIGWGIMILIGVFITAWALMT